MAVRKGGLGKGLDSMIPDTSAKVKKKILAQHLLRIQKKLT